MTRNAHAFCKDDNAEYQLHGAIGLVLPTACPS